MKLLRRQKFKFHKNGEESSPLKMTNSGKYTKQEVIKFRDEVTKDTNSWLENNGLICDRNVPFGWKVKIFQTSNGQDRTICRAPDGNKFKGLVPALQHMIKAEYSEEDVQLLANNLDKTGWFEHPKLPKGWYLKMKKRKVMF